MKLFGSVIPKRSVAAFTEIFAVIGLIFRAVGHMDMKKASALAAVIGQLFGAFVSGTPVTPYKDPIDMSRFELVWADEFDHGFDTSVWQGHYVYGDNDTQKRDTAWWKTATR